MRKYSCFSHTELLSVLELTKLILASEPLYLLFPLPRILFSRSLNHFFLSFRPCSKFTSSKRYCLAILSKVETPLSLSSHYLCYYLHETHLFRFYFIVFDMYQPTMYKEITFRHSPCFSLSSVSLEGCLAYSKYSVCI